MPTIRSDLTLIDVMGGIFLRLMGGIHIYIYTYMMGGIFGGIFLYFRIFPGFLDFPGIFRFFPYFPIFGFSGFSLNLLSNP
jgi:hypothetical protein